MLQPRSPLPLRLPWRTWRSSPRPPERVRARTALLGFLTAFVAVHAVALVLMETVRADLRDPEYGKRVGRLKARVAEHPGRPLVVVLGSSRAAMGVRPQAWEDVATDETRPLLFNMARIGGGPLFELLTLRRLLADGVRPAAVVIEYWPPLLHEAGPFDERGRVNPERLYSADLSLVRGYVPDAAGLRGAMVKARFNPLHVYRERLLAEVAPSWVPSAKRVEPGCRGMDGWGWVPGLDADPARRPARLAHFEPIYRQHFERFAISLEADRALRECVAIARENGISVALAWLPEATEFRGWYPPHAERLAQGHLGGLCGELSVPRIDARTWMPDDAFADGFHLSPSGAAAFTRRLGSAVEELGWHAPPAVR